MRDHYEKYIICRDCIKYFGIAESEMQKDSATADVKADVPIK